MGQPENLRSAMPATAAWIDALRAAFGADQIDPSIRAGMKGADSFYACENGHEIGRRDVRVYVTPYHNGGTKIDDAIPAARQKTAGRGR